MPTNPDMPIFPRWLGGILIACCLVSTLACSTPYATESRRGNSAGERVEVVRLSPEDQRALRREMSAIAAGHEPVSPPTPAAHGARWSDLDLAVYYATAEVEMAVVRTERTAERHRYVIETIDEKPAELIVHRRPPPEIYAAEASVGRFGDETERARRLVEALHTHLKELGRKRDFSGQVGE